MNAAAKDNVTPLHEAARLGKTRMMRLLVDKGANRFARDIDGRTPADWSSDGRFDSQATLRLLAPSLPKSAQ